MFFLSLALLGQSAPTEQSATLDTAPFDAALTCARVAGTGILPGPRLLDAGIFNYYLMLATVNDPKGGSLTQRMPRPQAALTSKRVRMPVAATQSLLRQCDARFPQARKPGPFTLPKAGFERDMMCTLSLTVMRGEAESEARRTGDRKPIERYATAIRNYEPGVNAGLVANGFPSWLSFFDAPLPAFVTRWSVAANPHVFSAACIAALRTPAGPRQ